jgi:hypothetical protein
LELQLFKNCQQLFAGIRFEQPQFEQWLELSKIGLKVALTVLSTL